MQLEVLDLGAEKKNKKKNKEQHQLPQSMQVPHVRFYREYPLRNNDPINPWHFAAKPPIRHRSTKGINK